MPLKGSSNAAGCSKRKHGACSQPKRHWCTSGDSLKLHTQPLEQHVEHTAVLSSWLTQHPCQATLLPVQHQ